MTQWVAEYLTPYGSFVVRFLAYSERQAENRAKILAFDFGLSIKGISKL